MKRYLVRTVRHNKAGKRIGKYTPIYAKNRKEAAMKHLMKDTFAVGAGSMIGAGALGSMASMSGVPAGLGSNIMGAAGVGFTALNYGQALKNVKSSFDLIGNKSRRREGWSVHRFWDDDILKRPNRIINRLNRLINKKNG